MNPGQLLLDWLGPFGVNLLTAVLVLLLGAGLGGWLAWRKHQAELRARAQISRKPDTEST